MELVVSCIWLGWNFLVIVILLFDFVFCLFAFWVYRFKGFGACICGFGLGLVFWLVQIKFDGITVLDEFSLLLWFWWFVCDFGLFSSCVG